MEDLMQRLYKKLLLTIIFASFMPTQSHAFSQGLKNTLVQSLAWARGASHSVLNSGYDAAKKYTIPAFVGLGLLSIAASSADYYSNKNELDILQRLKNDLENQHKKIELSVLSSSYSQITKHNFAELKKLLDDYDEAVKKNSSPPGLVFACYEHDLAIQERQTLDESKIQLNEQREMLLNDSLCQEKVGTELGVEGSIADTLREHLPNYHAITSKHFDPVVAQADEGMNADQAQRIIEQLERESNACINHVNVDVYKKLKLDQKVKGYLKLLKEHALAVKKNIEKLSNTKALLEQYNNPKNNQYPENNQYQEVVVNYGKLYKHVASLICDRQKCSTRIAKGSWHLPATLCAIAGTCALIKQMWLKWKGN